VSTKKQLEEEIKKLKEEIDSPFKGLLMHDRPVVKGWVAVNFDKDDKFQHVKIDVSYLKEVLTAIETLGTDDIIISVKTNNPIIFRASKNDTIGMCIAPRVTCEDDEDGSK